MHEGLQVTPVSLCKVLTTGVLLSNVEQNSIYSQLDISLIYIIGRTQALIRAWSDIILTLTIINTNKH